MSNTPYTTSDSVLRGYDLSAIATTAPIQTGAYGFSQAQATAIITQLNAIIAMLEAGYNAVVSSNGL